MTGPTDFQTLVDLHYAALYRFALSLTHQENEASDFTQQTFYVWATKGHQLRDSTKAKAWLFTTLHRLFLESQRRQMRFPHDEIEEVVSELPDLDPDWIAQLDSPAVVAMLARVSPVFQAPVALFYLDDYSYKEIAGVLEIPLGTVKSRIARGLAELHTLFSTVTSGGRA